MRRSLLGLGSALLLAAPAGADPIVIPSTSSIALSPGQTLISFDIDPNGTALSSFVLNFSGLAAGLTIVGITSAEPSVISISGPTLSGGDWIASFGATFATDRSAQFTIGTLTLVGSVPGTRLFVEGNFSDSQFNDILLSSTEVAVVVPEPATTALVGLGLAALAGALRRRDPARRPRTQRRSETA